MTPILPQHLQLAKQVEFNPPPTHLMDETMSLLEAAMKQIKPDKNGQMMFIAHRQGPEVKVNFAIVAKNDEGNLQVMTWIGKTWGRPVEAGVAAGWSF